MDSKTELDLMLKLPTPTKGNRHNALTRMAYLCMEAGYSEEETLELLYNTGSRWGKLPDTGEAGRKHYYSSIIAHTVKVKRRRSGGYHESLGT